jgi:cytochrome c oxidase cbb3-type subunit III
LDRDEPPQDPTRSTPILSWLILLAIGSFLAAGWLAYSLLVRRVEPVPEAIAADPLLVRGREIYLERCVSCHGPSGRGDGPLAKGLTGPPPRNLALDPWKHGDRPEQVLAVLADGVKDAQMPGWSGTYGPEDLKAVAAYVYQIAGKSVPDTLRGQPGP